MNIPNDSISKCKEKRTTKINITITVSNDAKLRLLVKLKLRLDNSLKNLEEIFAFIGKKIECNF